MAEIVDHKEAKKHFSQKISSEPTLSITFQISTKEKYENDLHYFLLGVMWAESRLKEVK